MVSSLIVQARKVFKLSSPYRGTMVGMDKYGGWLQNRSAAVGYSCPLAGNKYYENNYYFHRKFRSGNQGLLETRVCNAFLCFSTEPMVNFRQAIQLELRCHANTSRVVSVKCQVLMCAFVLWLLSSIAGIAGCTTQPTLSPLLQIKSTISGWCLIRLAWRFIWCLAKIENVPSSLGTDEAGGFFLWIGVVCVKFA